MKKLSLIFASMVLFAGISFASPIQAKQTDKKETKKTEKKTTTTKKTTKTTKSTDKKAK